MQLQIIALLSILSLSHFAWAQGMDGELCGGFMAIPCSTGFVCLGSKGAYPGVCREQCNSTTSTCGDDGLRTCIKGVCLPALTFGDTCNVSDKLYLVFTGVCNPADNLVCKVGRCVQVAPVSTTPTANGTACPCSSGFTCSFNRCVPVFGLGSPCKGTFNATDPTASYPACDENLVCWGGTFVTQGVCYPAPQTYGKLCYTKKGTCGPYYTCYNPKPDAKIGICSPAALPGEECNGKVRVPRRCTKGYVCMQSAFDSPSSPGICTLPDPLLDWNTLSADSTGAINSVQPGLIVSSASVSGENVRAAQVSAIDPLKFDW